MKSTVLKPAILIDFLIQQYPNSPRTRIKKILSNGNVKCNGKTVTLHSHKITTGDIVEINTSAGPSTKAGLPFSVLFEDQYLIVVDKPVGIVTSCSDNSISVNWIISKFLKNQSKGKIRSHVIHRLDKEVSGVLMLAKSEAIMDLVKNNWKKTEKRYYALGEGIPKEPEGTIKSWLIEDDSQKVYSTSESSKSKLAITKYKTIKHVNNNTLFDVLLETGRKNQIRVHLSDIGCPIVGDRKYGASNNFIRRIRLHAYFVSFPHPVTNKKIIIESPMPDGFLILKDKDEDYK